MNSIQITVIGGDSRQVRLADALCRDGYSVNVYGLPCTPKEAKVNICQDLCGAVSTASYILLPLPYSPDGRTVNAPKHEIPIKLEDIVFNASRGTCILAGKTDEAFMGMAAEYGLTVIDYFRSERLIIKNLIPTVEGALQLMMEKLPITIHGSRCLITGFGRIGRMLAAYLHNMGAQVTVCARKERDFAYTEILGYKGITYSDLSKNPDVDCIINTVPSLVITSDTLSLLRRDILIIDLASSPGGVDFDFARKMGLNVEWAQSLPGKVAPQTAAEIIKDTVISIINDTNERSENQ